MRFKSKLAQYYLSDSFVMRAVGACGGVLLVVAMLLIFSSAAFADCRTGETEENCKIRLEKEAARRVLAAKKAEAEYKQANCAYADRYVGRGGDYCSEALKQMTSLEKRSEAMGSAANNIAMIGSQIAVQKAKNNPADLQKANGQVLSTSAIAMLSKGAAEIAEGQSLRSIASQANSSKDNVAEASKRFDAIKAGCERDSLQADGKISNTAYEQCMVAKTDEEKHKFGSGVQGSYLYGRHATDGSKELEGVAKKAKESANGKQMSGLTSLLGGAMALKMAKQSQDQATNLTTLMPNTYRLATPNLNPIGDSTGSSEGKEEGVGTEGEISLPGGTGGTSIRGGLAKGFSGSGALSTYAPGSTSASGGNAASGGSAGGASSLPPSKAAKKNVVDKMLGEISAGDFSRVSGAPNPGGGANANALAKCLINPALPECANIGSAKEISLAQPERKIASDKKPTESTASVSDASLFEQVSSKIRWLNSNGVI